MERLASAGKGVFGNAALGGRSKSSKMEFSRQPGRDGVVRAAKGPFRSPATLRGVVVNVLKDSFLTFFIRDVQFPWATILVTSPGHSLG